MNNPDTDPRHTIVTAAEAEIARRSRLLPILAALDPKLAARAVGVFGDPAAAAEWLLSQDIRGFRGVEPVTAAVTPAGRQRVLDTLARVEHGIPF